jgi:predicted GNAT family acetyltransferase
MHLVELSDAASFLTRSSELLLKSEAQNNLLLSSALTLARASVTRSVKLSFYTVEQNRKTVCAALNSAERRLLLSTASEEAAHFMGCEMAARQVLFRGVLGPAETAAAFCEGFSSNTGASKNLKAKLPQNVLKLETSREVQANLSQNSTQSSGLTRLAKEKDLKILMKWTRQFVSECGMDESERESEEMLRRYIEGRQLFLWEDSKPVAMAGYSGVTPNGVRVNMVYTDPAHRSRGYAGSLVNVLSQRLLADGHRFCFLYVESENVAANRVYRRLGYKSAGQFIEYKFA